MIGIGLIALAFTILLAYAAWERRERHREMGLPPRNGWTVRVYRESDDAHIHSAENVWLSIGLKEVGEAILRDGVTTAMEEEP